MSHTSLLSSLTRAEDRDDWHALNTDLDFRKEVVLACRELVDTAYGQGDELALWNLHDILARIYDDDFGPPGVDRADKETQPIHRDIAAVLEKAVLERELADITDDEVSSYPEDPDAYVTWLKARIGDHGSRRHPLYREYLRNEAGVEEFRFFLAQESNLDPRFDDILALMQLGVSGQQKLELAANYWDEMGNGDPADVHTAMFARALRTVGADDAYIAKNQLLETRISGNLSACLALSRRHYLKAVGFMGVTEYMVPIRFRDFVDGWRRAGLPEDGVRYHELHIGIDAQHASGWFKNVVKPLIRDDPRSGREIATGALIRLNSSLRYLDAVLAHLRTATERPN
ncbi:iron-containing redox enzyme family protein [Streptomyces sp. NPDC007808]|uniref:iron-containing redox enzyme family protein n=1 Tax=Streptomyces sp. NPDC007808 TaxID=3364779 RepID=UPI00369F5C8B